MLKDYILEEALKIDDNYIRERAIMTNFADPYVACVNVSNKEELSDLSFRIELEDGTIQQKNFDFIKKETNIVETFFDELNKMTLDNKIKKVSIFYFYQFKALIDKGAIDFDHRVIVFKEEINKKDELFYEKLEIIKRILKKYCELQTNELYETSSIIKDKNGMIMKKVLQILNSYEYEKDKYVHLIVHETLSPSLDRFRHVICQAYRLYMKHDKNDFDYKDEYTWQISNDSFIFYDGFEMKSDTSEIKFNIRDFGTIYERYSIVFKFLQALKNWQFVNEKNYIPEEIINVIDKQFVKQKK